MAKHQSEFEVQSMLALLFIKERYALTWVNATPGKCLEVL